MFAGPAACAAADAEAGPDAGALRLAYYDTELARDGPGVLLRDILAGKAPRARAVARVVDMVAPDILVLAGIDWDAEGRTARAMNALFAAPYPHLFSAMPNAGVPTGLDLDRNGRRGEARDAQGYGRFRGEGGMVVLSRRPFGAPRDHSRLLWQDVPGNLMQAGDTGRDVQRLSSMVHWVLPVALPGGGALSLGVFRATTPVFDGPEDRNGRRNRDEVLFWQRLLDGVVPGGLPAPFVILGGANLDPERGEGRRGAIRALLADPRLQDPVPVHRAGPGAPTGAGDVTVDWPREGGPGPMRVDYVLPSAGLSVHGSGVFWPDPETAAGAMVAEASRHRLIWVDLDRP